MNIEIQKEFQENEESFRLINNISYDDEEDRVVDIVNRKFSDMPQALRLSFPTHKDLYKLIDEDKYDDDVYNPDGYYFYELDTGFKNFIKDLTELELQRLTDIYGNLISEYLEKRAELLTRQHRGRVSIGLQVLEQNNVDLDLEKIKISAQPMLVTNEGTFAFNLKQVDGAEGLKGITDNIYDTIYQDLNNQAKTMRSSYERKINKLKEMFEKEKNTLFVEILKNSKEILMNWDFIEYEGHLYLKYKERIKTIYVVKNNIRYDYPGAPQFDELYVSGLKVRVAPYIRAEDVKITRGRNVHFRGQTGCIGDLTGQPLFNVLKDLPGALQTANMDSPLNNDVASYVRTRFLRYVEENEIQGTSLGW